MNKLHLIALGIAIGQHTDVKVQPKDLGDFSSFLELIEAQDYDAASDFVKEAFDIDEQGKLAESILSRIRKDTFELEWMRLRSRVQYCQTPQDALEMIQEHFDEQ